MTTLRLACTGKVPFGEDTSSNVEKKPALLISYYYLDNVLKHMKKHTDYQFRNWAMDSGAFSAHHSGAAIDLQEYIERCQQLLKTDPKLVEIFALDVIGNWRLSMKNLEKMWDAGVEAIPCYHSGEPWDVLLHIAKNYPKIALGGIAEAPRNFRLEFMRQSMARIWPKKVHGFGVTDESIIMALPFHSVDATSWIFGPCAYAQWMRYGHLSLPNTVTESSLPAEVEMYLEIERRAKVRWKDEMVLLDTLEKPKPAKYDFKKEIVNVSSNQENGDSGKPQA